MSQTNLDLSFSLSTCQRCGLYEHVNFSAAVSSVEWETDVCIRLGNAYPSPCGRLTEERGEGMKMAFWFYAFYSVYMPFCGLFVFEAGSLQPCLA